MSTHTHAVHRHPSDRAAETFEQAGWSLVRGYAEDAAGGPAGWIDLSHRPKALALGPAVDPADGLTPGRALWDGKAFVCCRKPGERFVYDLLGPMPPAWPHPACTDITDGRVLLALIGDNALDIMRRLAAIDVERPGDSNPWFAVTRSHGIWLQIIKPLAGVPGYLLSVERSHGENLAHGLEHAGRHLGLRPMGLAAFEEWCKQGGLMG